MAPDGYLDYWKSLTANGVVVVNDWETAYYTNFSGSSGKGAQPMVVSYASSPAAEVVFADHQTGRFAHRLHRGARTPASARWNSSASSKAPKKRALAEKFVDFMLDVPFQEDMPLQMFVYPVNGQAKLPEEFAKYAQVAEKPATLEPGGDRARTARHWIQAWTEAVLR